MVAAKVSGNMVIAIASFYPAKCINEQQILLLAYFYNTLSLTGSY
jgi:hypothetical protein